MALYLRGQFDHISEDIPKLNKEAANAISNRFKTCVKVQVLGLNVSDDPKAVLKHHVVLLREFAFAVVSTSIRDDVEMFSCGESLTISVLPLDPPDKVPQMV